MPDGTPLVPGISTGTTIVGSPTEGGEYTIFREVTVQDLLDDSDQYAGASAKVLVAVSRRSAVGREQAVDAHIEELDAAGKWQKGTPYVPIIARYLKPVVRTGKQTRYS